MADIFISYASEDRSRVALLAKALEDQGWSVFWDFTIPVGKTWRQVITEALDEAKCAVVVWSSKSINSDWVHEEAEEAHERKILVPAMIDKVKPPLGFRRMQAARLIKWTGEPNHPEFEKLKNGIEAILGPSPFKVKEAEDKRAEEERKREQEEERKVAEEKRLKNQELKRKAEEERKQREAEAKHKADEDKRRKEEEELKRKDEEERKRKKAEPKGKIFVASAPDNATVKILDIDEPFKQGMELQPRKYHVQVSSEGYESQDGWIELSSGEEKRISFELAKIIPKVARLFVETVPEDATVRILNIRPKFSQGMELEPGSYHVEVAAEGYETERQWLDLAAGHEKPFRFQLVKIEIAEPKWLEKVITNSIGMKLQLIPSGKFMMGSPPDEPRRYDDEKQHEAIISKPLYLQTTEVSQAEWKKVMGKNPSYFKDCGDDCPVEQVSWDDAQEFISKLNQLENTNNYRLPTEAEWEYACRARAETAYSFGDEVDKLDEYAWYSANSGNQTQPAGKKKPNAWGLYDMHGNVWEWCQDCYCDYLSNSVAYPRETVRRVLRGGSWGEDAGLLRSAYRLRNLPDVRNFIIGFRVARDI